MSNKWKRIGQDAWVEIPQPIKPEFKGDFFLHYGPQKKYEEELTAYNNRTHHPIANLESGWWKEGEVKCDDEFELKEDCTCPYGRDVECVRGKKFDFYERCKIAIPLNPQPMSERKFSLGEMLECWQAGYDRCSELSDFSPKSKSPDTKKYFKEKFNIDL